jgi:hypothetical protein
MAELQLPTSVASPPSAKASPGAADLIRPVHSLPELYGLDAKAPQSSAVSSRHGSPLFFFAPFLPFGCRLFHWCLRADTRR